MKPIKLLPYYIFGVAVGSFIGQFIWNFIIRSNEQ